MKTITTIIFCMLFTSALAIKTCDYRGGNQKYDDDFLESMDTYDSDSSEGGVLNEEELWMINLSKELLLNDNIDISVMALSQLNLYFADRVDTSTASLVLDSKLKLSILNRVIESAIVSTPALIAARSICKQSAFHGVCDVNQFNEKLFNQDPQNINVYFNELSQAVKDSDVELIDVILKQMSQAKYSRSLFPITLEFIHAVDRFIYENPTENLKTLPSLMEFMSEGEAVDLDVVMKQNVLQMFHISNFNMPELRPLMIACEQFQDDKKNCQSIAKLLIDNSDTHIMTMIGLALDETITELSGDSESLEASQVAKEKFNEYQSCLITNYATMNDPIIMFDSGLVAITTQGMHEGTSLESAALYLYDKFKSSSSEGMVDPRTCGLRYVDAD